MAEVIARVFEREGSVEGGSVELSNGETTLKGRVASESENEFLVDWEDGARSVENKSDYELVVATRTAAPATVHDEPLEIGDEFAEYDLPEFVENPNRGPFEASKVAQENPAQPAGWAVPPMDANAHPGGELMAVEMEKRNDTAAWEDSQNRAPVDAENPAQPAGFAVPPATGGPIPGQGADGLMMAARVIAEDITGENGLVELTNGNLRVAGKILAADDETFIVEWEDERRTVESKADYDLVIEAGVMDTLRQTVQDFRDDRLRSKDMKQTEKHHMTDIEMRHRGLACDNCGNAVWNGTGRLTTCDDCAASPEAAASRKREIGEIPTYRIDIN